MKRTIAITLTISAIAQATDARASWLVYTSAQASAHSDTTVMDSSQQCSGTLASTGYCGPTFSIFADQTSLNSTASATAYPSTSYYSGYGYQHGDASASADLATGSLRISDHAISQGARGESTYGGAVAQLQDTLHFSSETANPFAVTVRLHVDGLFDGYQQPRFSFGLSNAVNVLAGTAGWGDSSDGDPACVGDPGITCTHPAALVTFNVTQGWSQFGPSDFVGTFLVDPRYLDAALGMTISAGDGTDDNGAGITQTFSEFGYTATVQFDLPAGVTFTSDSGVFLKAAGVVPEPAAWTTMLAGFALVGGAMRRRRIVGSLATVRARKAGRVLRLGAAVS